MGADPPLPGWGGRSAPPPSAGGGRPPSIPGWFPSSSAWPSGGRGSCAHHYCAHRSPLRRSTGSLRRALELSRDCSYHMICGGWARDSHHSSNVGRQRSQAMAEPGEAAREKKPRMGMELRKSVSAAEYGGGGGCTIVGFSSVCRRIAICWRYW